MGIEPAARNTRPCRYCFEPMDVRASFCPHCQRRTLGALLRGEVRSLALTGLFLLVALPLAFKVIVYGCGQIGKHLMDGLPVAAQAQPAHKAPPKAH
jgi:hypothetical protein